MREDTHTRTVDDAARFDAAESDQDEDDEPEDEPAEPFCCNQFDCPCGGDGRFGR